MTAYYSQLKPGRYDAALTPPTAPSGAGRQKTTQPVQVGGWQTPNAQVAQTTQPANNYGSVLAGAGVGATAGVPAPIQGHPTGDLGAGASTAASQAGQKQQQAQGSAMASASNTDPYKDLDPATAARYRQQAAAAAGMGASANAASTAASTAGQKQESAQGNAMATASNDPYLPPQASATTPPVFSTTLQKQGPLTEAGGLYDGYVTDVLKGDRAIAGVDSARSDSERRNALTYSHTLQQAQEAAAQSGLQPGTAGYNRIIQEAMSGIASQNLDRTNSVNQLQRQGYQDILGLGKGIEDTAYGRATDERNYQTERADTGYTRGVNERAYTDSRGDITYNRNKTDSLQAKTEKLAAINSIEDPKARQAAMNAYLAEQGGDSTYGAILGMYNADGSLKPEYQSQNPAQGDYQQRIAELKAYYPGKTDAEYQAMAIKEREADRAVTRGPISEATDANTARDLVKIINSGAKLNETQLQQAIDSKAIKSYTATGLKDFVGKDGAARLAADSPGGLIAIDGQAYKVIGGDQVLTEKVLGKFGDTQEKHIDYTEFEAPDGTKKYLWSNGTGILYDFKPPTASAENDPSAWDKVSHFVDTAHKPWKWF